MDLSGLKELDNTDLIVELNEISRKCRIKILDMIYRAQAGHPGGSLSEIDLLVALYCTQLRFNVDDPDWSDRDRFILSKGHACLVLYSALYQLNFLTKVV